MPEWTPVRMSFLKLISYSYLWCPGFVHFCKMYLCLTWPQVNQTHVSWEKQQNWGTKALSLCMKTDEGQHFQTCLCSKARFSARLSLHHKCLTLDTQKEWKKAKSAAIDDIEDEIPNYLFGSWSWDCFIALAQRPVMDWRNMGCAHLSLIHGLSHTVGALSLDPLRLT